MDSTGMCFELVIAQFSCDLIFMWLGDGLNVKKIVSIDKIQYGAFLQVLLCSVADSDPCQMDGCMVQWSSVNGMSFFAKYSWVNYFICFVYINKFYALSIFAHTVLIV